MATSLNSRPRTSVRVPRVIQIIDPMALPGMAEFHAKQFAGSLKIGNRITVPVLSVEDASHTYSQLRDESGEGGSSWPEGVVTIGRDRFYVSYNGKVWTRPGKEWKDGDEPVFSPYGVSVRS